MLIYGRPVEVVRGISISHGMQTYLRTTPNVTWCTRIWQATTEIFDLTTSCIVCLRFAVSDYSGVVFLPVLDFGLKLFKISLFQDYLKAV